MRFFFALLAAVFNLAAPGVLRADWSLLNATGSEVRPQPEPGGPALLLHFWATWCPSCREDLKDLQSAAAKCDGGSVRVLTVNVGESEQDIASFVAEQRLTLPVLRDPRGRAWRQIDRRGLPMNLLWSATTRRTEVGPKSYGDWRSTLLALGCDTKPRRSKEAPATPG